MSAIRLQHDYPLSAVVGQDLLRTALLVCAVNPGLGGVLIRGDKGSAKSTAARGLATVLPPVVRNRGCVFNCVPGQPAQSCEVCQRPEVSLETVPAPFVTLPLGATEDRVLGSLDFERALKEGRRALHPGLLANAHRGVLYIDEVNLLADHLVDSLLDAAAMGVNHVQRENLSLEHPAHFALIGTMNLEEGELRPQLLDRFGLMVDVLAPEEPAVRSEIVRRRLAWEADPAGFNEQWRAAQSELRSRILRARALLPGLLLPESLRVLVSELCCTVGARSLRADIVMNKAACALAALEGRTSIAIDDISRAARLVLPHRRRKPLSGPELEEALDRLTPPDAPPPSPQQSQGSRRENESPPEEPAPEALESSGTEPESEDASPEPPAQVFAPQGLAANPPRIELRSAATPTLAGRRSTASQSERGREVRSVLSEHPTSLALTATLCHSVIRTGGQLAVTAADLHQKIKADRQGALLIFAVDTSGSMAAWRRMELVKATVLSLLQDSYQRRDLVAVIGFRGKSAEVLLTPTRSIELAERQLRQLPTGGRTPLPHALQIAFELLTRFSSEAGAQSLLILLTDGRANVPLQESGHPWRETLEQARVLAAAGFPALVLDTEVGFVRLGRARALAEALQAQVLPLDGFDSRQLAMTIRGRLHGRKGHPVEDRHARS